MADAMEMMILSILGPALHCDWMVPPWQQALLTTVSILSECGWYFREYGVVSKCWSQTDCQLCCC